MARFSELRSAYPIMGKAELFSELGGEWPGLVDNPSYQNTCAIRMSVALAANGYKISGKYKEAVSGSGQALILRVKTMHSLVTSIFGQSSWGMSKNPGTKISPDDLPARSGIICFQANWSDATGHFDLWDGAGFVGSGSVDAISDGFSIEIWFVP